MAVGSVVTFYSYKGGVGRSFLLANVAATLSRWGYRVLCVDFDLEAPGLSHYFSGWTTPDEPAQTTKGTFPKDLGLTERQLEVLRLLVQGLTTKEMAARLGVSDATAKSHLSQVFNALHVRSRSEAVVAVVNRGVLLKKAEEPYGGEVDDVQRIQAGLLELVEQFENSHPVELEDFVTMLNLPSPHAPISLLAAGRRDDSYMGRVQRLDWARLYAEHRLGDKFERIRSIWKSTFDFVLIDSRTGVSDTGGICTVQLPDFLVTVFAPNRQNIEGVLDIGTRAAKRRNELPYDRQGLTIIPVLSRFDQRTEQELAGEWIKLAENQLGHFLRPWVHRTVSPAQFFNRVLVPYFSALSFGEDIPAVEAQENVGPERITYYIDTVAALLARRGEASAELMANRDGYVDTARSRIRTKTGRRVLLVDDHAFVRQAVRDILTAMLDTDAEFFEAENFAQALDFTNASLDLAVLDLPSPDAEGLQRVRAFRKAYPGVAAIVFAEAALDRNSMEALLDVGVRGYIPKTLSSNLLLDAFRQVLNGGVYFPPELAKEKSR